MGAVTGFGITKSLEDDYWADPDESDVLTGTIVGAFLGGAVGALIGAVIPRDEWEDAGGCKVDVETAPDGSPGAVLSFRF